MEHPERKYSAGTHSLHLGALVSYMTFLADDGGTASVVVASHGTPGYLWRCCCSRMVSLPSLLC